MIAVWRSSKWAKSAGSATEEVLSEVPRCTRKASDVSVIAKTDSGVKGANRETRVDVAIVDEVVFQPTLPRAALAREVPRNVIFSTRM